MIYLTFSPIIFNYYKMIVGPEIIDIAFQSKTYTLKIRAMGTVLTSHKPTCLFC